MSASATFCDLPLSTTFKPELTRSLLSVDCVLTSDCLLCILSLRAALCLSYRDGTESVCSLDAHFSVSTALPFDLLSVGRDWFLLCSESLPCTFPRATSQVPSWITRKDPAPAHTCPSLSEQTLSSRYYPGPAMDTDASSTTGQCRGSRALPSMTLAPWPFWIPTILNHLPTRLRRIVPNSLALASSTAPARTMHTKLTVLFPSVSTLKSGSPKFHSRDIPLDAEALQRTTQYLPVATDATNPIPPFLNPLSHLKNFIWRLKTRANGE
ncbi:hypothetical protein B0H19DRAFT_1383521 [Mycena capillaripes]|nr:hypothetical protein B0H19DRAFT_1383521 [Mycena capillaripes]